MGAGENKERKFNETYKRKTRDEEPYKQKPWRTRYKEALKTLLPVRKTKKEKAGKLPLNDVGCINYLTIGWITKIMWKAFKVGLVPTDLYQIDEPDDAMKNAKRFERLWEEEKRRCHDANVKKDKKTPIK